MVAKESVVLNPRAPLLLSVNAGVYPQLARCATAIQPFDVTATATAFAAVTQGRVTPPEDARECAESLHSETPAKWLGAILEKIAMTFHATGKIPRTSTGDR